MARRKRIIVDCYTDEPAGLGVPPFLGVYPRYVAGRWTDPATYLTIDDLRLHALWKKTGGRLPDFDPPEGKTRIDIINRTRSPEEVDQVLRSADRIFIIAGVQTPGKYLRARPGTVREVLSLLRGLKCRLVLVGPAASGGTQLRGGTSPERFDPRAFEEIWENVYEDYDELRELALRGASILRQIPDLRVVEIETGRGCPRSPGCSFCTEPLKGAVAWRRPEDVRAEVEALWEHGARYFRLGKQSCLFSYSGGDTGKLKELLEPLWRLGPCVLHIDNANPEMVTEERAALIVRYTTPGSTAALGVESFDPEVRRANNLNADVAQILEAVRILNEVGSVRGENGLPWLLPGINILLGLVGETRETLEINLKQLKEILAAGYLIRRINIRQVVPFPGTELARQAGTKFLRKNRQLYARWIEQVRREVDLPMLKRVFPVGTVLRGLLSECHEGNVTFLRQPGSYPLIVGVRKRLPLGEFYDVRITDHMLRSVVGEVVGD